MEIAIEILKREMLETQARIKSMEVCLTDANVDPITKEHYEIKIKQRTEEVDQLQQAIIKIRGYE